MICCVTGHRPKGFPFSRDKEDIIFIYYKNQLSDEVDRLANEGYTHFITGMAEGADIDFAEAVILLRMDIPHIKLEAALPYPITPAQRRTAFGEERDGILLKCNIKHAVSPHYHKGCMQKRNEYMVDKADIVLAIWNGKTEGGTWNTIKYARSKGKPIRYIMLNKLEEEFFGV